MKLTTTCIPLSATVLICLASCVDAVQRGRDVVAADQTMVLDFVFSSDGSKMVAAGNALSVYDVESSERILKIDSARLIRSVVCSPKKDEFATAGDDGVIRFWNPKKSQPTREIAAHSGMVTSLAYSPDGAFLASAGRSDSKGELKIWSGLDGRLIREEAVSTLGASIVFSSDGKRIAFSKRLPKSEPEEFTSTIEIRRIDNWKLVQSAHVPSGFVMSLTFVDEDHLIATGGECIPIDENSCRPTGRIWLIDLMKMENPARQIDLKQCGYYRSSSLSSTTGTFATGAEIKKDRYRRGLWIGASMDGHVELRDSNTGNLNWSSSTKTVGDTYGVQISPDEKVIGCAVGNRIILFDAKTGAINKTIQIKP